MRFAFLVAFIATVQSTIGLGIDGPCGGLLESDAGEYTFPPEEILEQGQVCVWIVKLISRQNVQLNLTELGEGLAVSLYAEHNPGQLSIRPTRLTSSDEGISVGNIGQTLVVVLSTNGSSKRFAFTWDSLALTEPCLLTAANYVNQETGHVLWNRFNNRERLTLSLNTDQSQSLDVEANADFRDCSLVNHCQCSYVALYEITKDGYLREVSIACGRTSQVKVQNLFPNILAFVYLNSSYSVGAHDFAEIKWAVSESVVSKTPTPTTTTQPLTTTQLQTTTTKPPPTITIETTTTEPPATTTNYTTLLSSTSTTTQPSTSPAPIIVTNECGGVVEVGGGETVIEYLAHGGYSEFCVWSLLPTVAYRGWTFTYEGYAIQRYAMAIKIGSWGDDGIVATTGLSSYGNTTYNTVKPNTVIAYQSNSSITGEGFKITIKGTRILDGDFKYRSFVLNQTQGTFSYPKDFGFSNYEQNERVTVIVPATTTPKTQVSVDYTDIQDDFLTIYQLRGRDLLAYTLIGRTNGSHPEGVSSLFSSSEYPRLFMFNSNNNSMTGKGFTISWKPE